LKRVLQAIPAILAIITITFLMLHLAPGDPLYIILGDEVTATPEFIADMRAQLGLDRPLHIQYLDYMSKAIRGDLGYSLFRRTEVTQLVLERLYNTLLLAITSLVLSVIIGIGLGLVSSKKPYSLIDNLINMFSVVGYAVPAFWLGQILISIFVMNLGWFPVAGTSTIGLELYGKEYWIDRLRHIALPVTTLTIVNLAFLARLTRSTMLNIVGEDYILTAKSKGLSENTILLRHGFRNALLPLITTLTLRLGFIISGALLVETVFAWPGIGRLTYDALFNMDYPTIMGIFIITCTMVVIMTLVADILYAFIDPRIRYR
jgi:peptide/nickel transport system permease protein